MESSTARARPLHAPLHAVTHVKRLPDRATRTAARTPLSAENGAREGADGARAGLERGTRSASRDSLMGADLCVGFSGQLSCGRSNRMWSMPHRVMLKFESASRPAISVTRPCRMQR